MVIAHPTTRRQKEAGYTLLMVVFMVATMMILALAVTPNIITEGQRQKEVEMVWRGEQYKRAITLYVAKFGKYPTKIEDLTRETNGVRFLRRAYTDPLNREDGSWRVIYGVIPGGQSIGSLKSSSVLLAQPSTQGAGGSPFTLGPQGLPQLGAQAQQPGIGGPRSSISTTNLQNSQPQPLTGEVIGGN